VEEKAPLKETGSEIESIMTFGGVRSGSNEKCNCFHIDSNDKCAARS